MKVIKDTLLICLITIGLVFIFELIARLFHPCYLGQWAEREQFFEYDSRLGWRGTPHQSGKFKRRDFSVWVKHNRFGFRGKAYPHQREVGKKRILVLGDSYVWGYGVNEGDIFTSRIEKKNSSIEIVNMGVSGYGNDQELILLNDQGLSWDPDLVIVVVTLPSDFDNNTHAVQYGYPKPLFNITPQGLHLQNTPVPQQNLFQRSLIQLHQSSALFHYIGHRIVSMQDQKTPNNTEGLELTFSILKEIAHVCEKENIDTLFLLNPVIDTSNIISQSPDTDQLYQRMLEQSLQVVHLFSVFQKFTEETQRRVIFEHDSHWNELGHKLVSDIVLEHI